MSTSAVNVIKPSSTSTNNKSNQAAFEAAMAAAKDHLKALQAEQHKAELDNHGAAQLSIANEIQVAKTQISGLQTGAVEPLQFTTTSSSESAGITLIGSGSTRPPGRMLQAGQGTDVQPFDIEAGQAAAQAVAALPPDQQAALANSGTAFWQGVVDGGGAAVTGLQSLAGQAGSAAWTGAQYAAGQVVLQGGNAAASIYNNVLSPTGRFVQATAQIAYTGLSAPVYSAIQGNTNIMGGLGAAAAGAGATLAGYYTGLNTPASLTAAGLLTAGVNIGFKPPANFDSNLRQMGGSVGVAAGYFGRYIVSAMTGVGVGHGVQAIQNAFTSNSNAVPNVLPPGAAPFSNATINQTSNNRGLLSDGPTSAEMQGINAATNQVWQQWTSDPTVKASLASALQAPGGAQVVTQDLYQTAATNYANQQTQTALTDFATSDPTGYNNYLNYVGATNGPASKLAGADTAIQTAESGAQNLINTQLATYVKSNPTGSLTSFYSQLSPTVKSQLSTYSNTIDTNNAMANQQIYTMEAAYQSFSSTGTQPTAAELTASLPANIYNSTTTEVPVLEASQGSSTTLNPAKLPGAGDVALGAGEVIGSSAATGAAVGSVVGIAGGPFAEVTVPVGAAIGAGIGAVVGSIGWALGRIG